MPEVEEAGFSCTACGRQYRWKAELAGKTVKCKCGSAVKVPRAASSAQAAPPPPPPPPVPGAKQRSSSSAPKPARPAPVAASGGDDDGLDALYALAEQASAVASDESNFCPNCRSQMTPEAVLCLSCGYDRRKGKVVAAARVEDPDKPKKSLFGMGKPKKVDPKKKKVVDALAPQGSFFVGILTSFALATGAALVYALVAAGIGHFVSFGWGNYVATFLIALVGIGAGVGMQIGQKGYSSLGGFAAAGVTLVVMLVARVLVIVLFGLSIISGLGAGDDGDSIAPPDPDVRTDGREEVGDIKQNLLAEAEKQAEFKRKQKEQWDRESAAREKPKDPEDPRVLAALQEGMYAEWKIDPKFANSDQHEAARRFAEFRATTMPVEQKKKIIAVMAEREKKERQKYELISLLVEEQMSKMRSEARSGIQYRTTNDAMTNKVEKMTPAEQEVELARLKEAQKIRDEAERKEAAELRAKELAEAATRPAATQASADDGLGEGAAADDGLGGDTVAVTRPAEGEPGDEEGDVAATAPASSGGNNTAVGQAAAVGQTRHKAHRNGSSDAGSSDSSDSSDMSSAVGLGIGIILFYVFFGGIWSLICMISAVLLAYRTAAGAVKG